MASVDGKLTVKIEDAEGIIQKFEEACDLAQRGKDLAVLLRRIRRRHGRGLRVNDLLEHADRISQPFFSPLRLDSSSWTSAMAFKAQAYARLVEALNRFPDIDGCEDDDYHDACMERDSLLFGLNQGVLREKTKRDGPRTDT